MAKFDLHEYARIGAQAKIMQLKEELESIYAAFPELRDVRETFPPKPVRRATDMTLAAEVPASRRRRMSAAQRKAVSERMRKYWAARRRANNKG